MRRHLARKDAFEDIGPVSFEAAQGGGSGIAGRPDVYIATAVVHVTIDVSVRRSPVRPVGVERFPGPNHTFGRIV
jgi:hypothetical protein